VIAVLSRCEIDTHRLKVEMELNSIEAIKNAVQSDWRCFCLLSAIAKELQMNVLHLPIEALSSSGRCG